MDRMMWNPHGTGGQLLQRVRRGHRRDHGPPRGPQGVRAEARQHVQDRRAAPLLLQVGDTDRRNRAHRWPRSAVGQRQGADATAPAGEGAAAWPN
eukprot:6017726-Pyramimonas_sp.AAC.1